MRKRREEKGITLVALIITIIVLLILAVVAISAVTGDGIIQHATNAKTTYENAQAVENSMIGEYESFLNKHNPNKKTIKFYIIISSGGAKIEYTAKEGMTWKEFLASEYNIENKYNFVDMELKYTLEESGDSILVKSSGKSGYVLLGGTGTLFETDEITKVKLDTVITNGKQWTTDFLYED